MTSNDQGDRSVGGDEQPVELDTNNQCNTHEQGTGNECSQQENSYEQVISQLHQSLANYSHDWIDITREPVDSVCLCKFSKAPTQSSKPPVITHSLSVNDTTCTQPPCKSTKLCWIAKYA